MNMAYRCHRRLHPILLAATAWTAALSLPAADDRPDYQPQLAVTGVLRSRGNGEMASLLRAWAAGF